MLRDEQKAFLLRLLSAPSPSGFEEAAARIWREEASQFADEVWIDHNGNSFARLHGNSLTLLIEGHIDELGLMVTHIDEQGYLWFRAIGGWDDQILTGQRVQILTRNGPIPGVIGRKPAHLLTDEEKGRASRIKDLWIDIGARDGNEAREVVRVGDPIVIDQPPLELRQNRLVARGLDNRIGAFIALEVLRALSSSRPPVTVVALAATQEEISFLGARTAAFALDPVAAIVIDVTHATDHPEADKRGGGDVRIGGGPVLDRGSMVHPLIFERLLAAAEAEGIPVTLSAAPVRTGTDADAIAPARAGIPTGLVSVPNRYMHSPNELVSLDDLASAIRLIARFIQDLGPHPDFRRL